MGHGAMTAQNFEFTARLARIEAAGLGSAKTTLYVGPDDSYQVQYGRRGAAQNSGMRGVMGNMAYPLTIISAFLIGVLGNLCTRWISFVSDIPPPTAENIDMVMVMDFVIAMMAASIIGVICRFGIREYIGLRIAGILAGMVGLHNLVHLYPTAFDTIFSPAWVGALMGSTEPGSLLIRGVSIAF
jgi:hypothetical protein